MVSRISIEKCKYTMTLLTCGSKLVLVGNRGRWKTTIRSIDYPMLIVMLGPPSVPNRYGYVEQLSPDSRTVPKSRLPKDKLRTQTTVSVSISIIITIRD
jgi:hypothetical protein